VRWLQQQNKYFLTEQPALKLQLLIADCLPTSGLAVMVVWKRMRDFFLQRARGKKQPME